MAENNFTGDLDLAARALERIAPALTELWNEGRYRMKRDEIRRVNEYLTRTAKAGREIRAVLKLFEEIAAVPNAETKIAMADERLGLIPARLRETATSH